MPDVHISFALKALFIILGALASAGLSFLVYRVTVPPISRQRRILLTVLRGFGLFLVFLLIAEPILSLVTRTIEKPLIAVLVDNSRSMTIQDPARQRKQALIDALQSNSVRTLSDIGSTRFGLFSNQLKWLMSFSPDSLTLDGDGTDISSILRAVQEQTRTANLQAVVLLSDGNSTTGANPLYEAEELGVPVFTVGIGDTSEQKDILVRKVLTNDITYIGNRVPVNATIRSSGYTGQRIEVLLKDESGILDRRLLTTETGTRDYEVPLSFVPQKEGVQKFTVESSSLPGELTTRNNRSSFFTKVLKRKMRILLFAGGPSQDVAFVRRALQADKNLEVKTFIGTGNGQFYEGNLTNTALTESDCIFLVGFPTTSTSTASVSAIADAVGGGKPAFYVLSRTIDISRMHALAQFLPFVIQSVSTDEYQAFIEIPETQRNNPLLKLSESLPSFEIWSKLPPIFKTQSILRSKPESEVLALTRVLSTTTNDPFLLKRSVDGQKSVALLGYGVWRWSMLADASSGNVLEPFLSNAVRWLTTREDAQQVRVQPTKQTFTTQESVEFVGQVYDQSYEPLDNASISVTLQHGSRTNELALSPVGSGRYEGSLDQLEEGDYRFTSKVTLDGKQIGEQTGRFAVGGTNVEFLETKMNKPLLQRMSNQTGGRYYDGNTLGTLPDDIRALSNFQPRERVRTSEFELWNISWMLALVVVTFSFEWFLRKRAGML